MAPVPVKDAPLAQWSVPNVAGDESRFTSGQSDDGHAAILAT
jgi:hypothetical protein